MILSVLIPAAGSARRMRGADKLLELVDGEPILRRQSRLAMALGPVRVTLPVGGFEAERRAALDGIGVEIVSLPNSGDGMAESLRQAVTMPGRGVMILLPDMPGIGAAEMALLAKCSALHPQCVVRGASQERAGHPVILPKRLLPLLLTLSGDAGAKEVIRAEIPLLVGLPGDAALLDLDSPEDWAAWRERAARSGRT